MNRSNSAKHRNQIRRFGAAIQLMVSAKKARSDWNADAGGVFDCQMFSFAIPVRCDPRSALRRNEKTSV
jgi:hypothetical protein